MGVQLNPLAVNNIKKGTVIFQENEQITSICLVVKGKVLISNHGSKIIVGTGSFIGIPDLYAGRVFSSYVALEDVVLFAFPVRSADEITNIFTANKDYRGLMVGALNRYIAEYDRIHRELEKRTDSLYTFVKATFDKYTELARQNGQAILSIDNIEELAPYDSNFTMERSRVEFYKEGIRIPMDALKAYYSHSTYITSYQVEEQAIMVSDMIAECIEKVAYISNLFEILINGSERCLFKGVAKLALDIANNGGHNKELMIMVEDIKDQIFSTERLFVEKVNWKLTSYSEIIEEIYNMVVSGNSNQGVSTQIQMKYTEKDTTLACTEMEGSLKKILDYSRIEEEEAEAFIGLINDFKNLRDKLSTDDKARILRKKIADTFYKIYEKVFLRAYEENSSDRIIDMFLSYGYMEETLLTKEQGIELYFLKNDPMSGPSKVYTLKEWLIQIYEGKKAPSKNEFDLDYIENLREMKKSTKLTPEQEKDYLENPKNRLNYEVMNMFRYNNRLVNGQISTFVPVLNDDSIVNSITTAFLTAKRVNEAMIELLKIDYSVFHREILFFDKELGIQKEYIMQAVYPDIILLPTFGQRTIMWQEITGKKRNTSGRFLVPIFVEGSLEDQLIKLFGQFRWELCRCVQGTSWNDIKYKSLTSEYSDYIQFYRKNRDLSEERKEKLKAQIQKGRHNTREIFVIDYELWMKSEISGAIRLNKVARELLATYCPYSLEYRERVGRQPLFQEAMTKFNRNQMKKNKEIDLRIRALEKDNIEIPEVILETQRFYRDL